MSAITGRRKRVALLVESSRSFGRGIVRGIADWVREHQCWDVFYQDCGLGELLPRWFRMWEGDGIIARLENRRITKAIAEKALPVVDVRGCFPARGVPVVRTCDQTVARLGVEKGLIWVPITWESFSSPPGTVRVFPRGSRPNFGNWVGRFGP